METSNIKVRLDTSGFYFVRPFKMAYKAKGEYEILEMSFIVVLGAKFSCFIEKAIFFKGDKDALNKEVNFLLKYICPDLLDKKANKATFKEYAEWLCEEVNKELKAQRESKTVVTLVAKVRMRKDKEYPEMAELLTKDGKEYPYLALPEQATNSLWFSEGDLQYIKMPFKVLGEYSPNGNGHSEPAMANATNFDDMPF